MPNPEERSLSVRAVSGRKEERVPVTVTRILSKPFRRVFVGRYVTPCVIKLENEVYAVESDDERVRQAKTAVLKEKDGTVTFSCRSAPSGERPTVAEYKFLILEVLVERGGSASPRVIYPFLLDDVHDRLDPEDWKQFRGEPKWKLPVKQALLELEREKDAKWQGYKWNITEQGRKTHLIMKAFGLTSPP